MTLRGRRVLVTGGNGFLGTALCHALGAMGADLYAVSRTGNSSNDNGTHWLQGDMSDAAAVRATWRVAQPAVVFHLASHGVGAPDLEHVPGTLMGDFLATINVLTAAAQEGCDRIVLAASLEEPTNMPAVPASPYAAAKWAATGYARMFYALYNTPVAITRPFMTYGPGQRSHKLIPRTIRALLAGRSPELSSGRRRVDWVYLDDVVRGLRLAGEMAGIEGAELDLGSGRLVALRDVVEQLAQLTGSSVPIKFGTLPERPFEAERRADVTSTFARVGWKAEVSLDEGLRRTVDWFRAHAVQEEVVAR